MPSWQRAAIGLGPGWRNCHPLEEVVREAVVAGSIEAEIRHVTYPGEVLARGVMSTPGLVIDGNPVSAGRIPTRQQIAAWLTALDVAF